MNRGCRGQGPSCRPRVGGAAASSGRGPVAAPWTVGVAGAPLFARVAGWPPPAVPLRRGPPSGGDGVPRLPTPCAL